jgi:hypothetical protein
MTYDPTKRGYSYIDGELPVRPRQPGAARTAQVLPRKNYDPAELACQASHQAREEAKQRNRFTAHTQAAIPADYEEDDADIDGNGDVWPPYLPTSVYRYDAAVPHGGNVRYQFHPDQLRHIPARRSAAVTAQGQRVRQEQRPTYIEDEDEEGELRTNRPGYHKRIQIHWLVLVGIGAIIALSLWIGSAWVTIWWQNTQYDWTYTQNFRTYSIDKAVGHNGDSTAHPSHFIVQNDKRHIIIIIELPADDWSKSIIYSAPTLIGDGQERTPVTISFVENARTGRLDLVLHVQDQTYIFTNNGTKFITPSGQ